MNQTRFPKQSLELNHIRSKSYLRYPSGNVNKTTCYYINNYKTTCLMKKLLASGNGHNVNKINNNFNLGNITYHNSVSPKQVVSPKRPNVEAPNQGGRVVKIHRSINDNRSIRHKLCGEQIMNNNNSANAKASLILNIKTSIVPFNATVFGNPSERLL